LTPRYFLPIFLLSLSCLTTGATAQSQNVPLSERIWNVANYQEPADLPTRTRDDVTLPASADDVRLSWPIEGTPVLNSPFGPRQLGSQSARYDWHRGIDLKMPMGTELIAPADGIVVHAGTHPAYRDTILQLRHNTEEPYFYTLYLHLLEPTVEAGDVVKKGDLVALSGQGSATYPHLHWEVRLGCLRQECCVNPYGFLEYDSTPPAPPVLRAAGSAPGLGRMALVSWSHPQDEIDYKSVEVEWGNKTIRADVDELNALSPRGQGSKLDDPLFFYETEGMTFALFPKRFNDSFPSADYEVFVWGLDNSVTEGSATVIDGAGIGSSAAMAPNAPPLSMIGATPSVMLQQGGSFSLNYLVTNEDSQPHTVSFEGESAQALPLTINPSSATIPAGGSVQVNVSGSLRPTFPLGVGDVVLLIASVDGEDWTPLLGGSLIDTSDSNILSDHWLTHDRVEGIVRH